MKEMAGCGFYHFSWERCTIFNGKTHYFDWAMASIAMLNYQRVTILVGGAITIL